MDLNKIKNELIFIPLGGSGEIGMNLNLYHYKGKWLIVDFGAGFADQDLPGVDMIVPDISFLIKIKKDILGMILTHAHEDHLGAVQYLWDEINCPVFTTPFTATFLKSKLSEIEFSNKIIINEVSPGGKIELSPFKIELVPLTHSAPEMQALVIRTELGNILHTGDWKFDHDPLIGLANDEVLLKQYGEEGILAMVGDSTNVFNPGVSGSEGDLRKSMYKIIKDCKNLVAVTTFASNVARIETIIKVAEECGRRVVLAGRSLWRVTDAAKEVGYLRDIQPFLDESEISKFPKEKILVLCTGCQGETLAASTKIANKSHPYIRLSPGDTVIFSSKIIPGNEKKIFKLFNLLVKQEVEVLTEKDHFVHVSGHPAREELIKMYKLVKPQVAIPVHGELVHMHEHAKLALEVGVPKSITVENGDMVKLAPGNSEIIAKVQAGYLAIDGHYLIAPNSPIMRIRRKIQNEGIVIITLVFDSKRSLLTLPIINTPGILDRVEDSKLIDSIIKELVKNIKSFVETAKKTKISNEAIINLTRSVVRRMIKSNSGKNPIIDVNIERIN
ncbi:MAG: ribonuclease J [Alphaproteobacteria bacterium]